MRKGFFKFVFLAVVVSAGSAVADPSPAPAHAPVVATGPVSGVDAFVSAVKIGCLPVIVKGSSAADYASLLKGGQMPPDAAAIFLQKAKGKAYVLPHPDHQIVMAVPDDGKSCTIFVRRIDRVGADDKLAAMLKTLGFAVSEPKSEKGGLNTMGYEGNINKMKIGVTASFSVKDEVNFQAAATVYKKK